MKPGRLNLITDVPGITVGNAEDDRARTGVTVVLPEDAATCAVDVRGGAPGLRETALLDPVCTVNQVDALVLSGGSAFGLDAAAGVTSWLAERGRGFAAAGMQVPIVPAAILFDLANGGDKTGAPPHRDLAVRACDAAASNFGLGNAGAGHGATAGRLKGGLGSASLEVPYDPAPITVGALAAVNSLGSVTMPRSRIFWSWPVEQDAEFGGPFDPMDFPAPPHEIETKEVAIGNTTLVVVATDALLDTTQATRLAIMAQNGLVRAIRPAHTPLDGDTLFTLSTGRAAFREDPIDLAQLGAHAADCVSRAIARAVYEAEDLGELKSYAGLYGRRGLRAG
ncbi:MAG: P1 family peptidase [Pseudomonadota bacterium]